jgi:LmbE family N-acetylglucosaminyl deacetylase
MMRRLLAVFAHPDDESAFAGTLAHYIQQGDQVSLICTTKGEAGEISDPALASPENLGSVREAELRCSCDVIGIEDLHLLGYCDSGMDGTPENEKITAFIQANPDEVRFKLVKLIRGIKPHAIITFEPFGWYGHPDHIAAGRYATEAYYLAGDPNAFPSAGQPWRPERLYHAAFPRSMFKSFIDYANEHGIEITAFDQIDFDAPDELLAQVTHVMDTRDYLDIKDESQQCHKTQFGEEHIFSQMPPEITRATREKEHFIQVEPKLEPAKPWLTDLLAGITG